MRVKIVEPGWGNFTGQMGEVDFVDGVSVEPLSKMQMGRIGASIRIDGLDDGLQQSASAEIVRNIGMNADQAMALEKNADDLGHKSSDREAPTVGYSRKSLGEIADKEGIEGLRAIGDIYGVKSRKIADLITLILQAQHAAGAAVDGEDGGETDRTFVEATLSTEVAVDTSASMVGE